MTLRIFKLYRSTSDKRKSETAIANLSVTVIGNHKWDIIIRSNVAATNTMYMCSSGAEPGFRG